jgi:hypothetical protein
MQRIIDGIFLGDKATSENYEELIANGITHIVSLGCASPVFSRRDDDHSEEQSNNQNETDYDTESVQFDLLSYPFLLDTPEQRILPIVDNIMAYIDNLIDQGGICLVHCVYGQVLKLFFSFVVIDEILYLNF